MAVCCIYLDIKGLEGGNVAKKGKIFKDIEGLEAIRMECCQKGNHYPPLVVSAA